MYHLHLRRNLRSLGFILILCSVIGSACALWWVNHTGLPESWRSSIENALAKRGVYVEVGALSYLPFRGLAASKVRFFSNETRTKEVSKLDRILLDFDLIKLTQGKTVIKRIELRDAELSLQINPTQPNSETLEINGANGILLIKDDHTFEIRRASGTIAGIHLTIDALFSAEHQKTETRDQRDEEGNLRQLIANILKELHQWKYHAAQAPQLRVFLEGNIHHTASITAKCSLSIPKIEKNGQRIEQVEANAELTESLLTITSLNAKNSSGILHGRMDYNFDNHDGRFDITSTLDSGALLKAWANYTLPSQIHIYGRQYIQTEGSFQLDENNRPQLSLTGSADCESVSIKGMRFDQIQTQFSWHHKDLYLKDIHITKGDEFAHGKALIQWPIIRIALHSTLSAEVYKPFVDVQPLEAVINDFTKRKKSNFTIDLEGGLDASKPSSWAVSGSASLKNINFKKVPLNSVKCQFSLSATELDFYNGAVEFNYASYPLRQSFNGPQKGNAHIDRIRYISAEKLVHVENVTGTCWAAPLVRLFAPEIAESLEQYRFQTPPTLSGNGVVDVTPQGRTQLQVHFQSNGLADYTLLGKNLTLTKPEGKISIQGTDVKISNLTLNVFDGPVTASFLVQKNGKFSGDVNWSKLSVDQLSSTYEFNLKGGYLTGKAAFALNDQKVETMEGSGFLVLEKSELFSVPMFGPLSKLIGGIIGDRRVGSERAKQASCNYTIEQGILATKDFQTATTSLNFTGDGKVNLKNRNLDMTIRMNARGLLGLITLPLKPFYGMFQFRGTGTLSDPEWRNVLFTAPPKEQDHLLNATP